MRIWHHDAFGALTGEGEARRDPEDRDRFLVPRFATPLPPPKQRAGKVAVFDGEAWSLAEDRRGQVWDLAVGAPIVWDRPGPLPEGLLADLPPSQAHRWDAAAQAWVAPPPPEERPAARYAVLREALLDALAAGETPDPETRAAFRALRAARRAAAEG